MSPADRGLVSMVRVDNNVVKSDIVPRVVGSHPNGQDCFGSHCGKNCPGATPESLDKVWKKLDSEGWGDDGMPVPWDENGVGLGNKMFPVDAAAMAKAEAAKKEALAKVVPPVVPRIIEVQQEVDIQAMAAAAKERTAELEAQGFVAIVPEDKAKKMKRAHIEKVQAANALEHSGGVAPTPGE
jgi:hypothetical protein